ESKLDGEHCGQTEISRRFEPTNLSGFQTACFSRVGFRGTKQRVTDCHNTRKRGRDSNTGSNPVGATNVVARNVPARIEPVATPVALVEVIAGDPLPVEHAL